MRFGFGLSPFQRYPDLAALQQTLRLAEEMGLDAASIGDHAVMPYSHAKTVSPFWHDPIVTGTVIATGTKRLGILYNVFVLPYHHPVILAKSLATLDVFSGGRVTVGVGVGWIKEEFEALGVPFNERGALTDEYIKVMRTLWNEEKPAFQGKYISFDNIAFQPRPLQRPLPIIIGGGTQKTLERAAALGDGWHPLGRTWGTLTKDVAELKRLLAARGRSMEGFRMGYTLYYSGAAGQTQRHTSLAGGEEASSLSTDIGEAREQVARLKELGVSYITLRFRGLTHTELCEAMARFAKDALPKLR